jgi:lysozyme family protein
MVDLNALTAANAKRWGNARITRNLVGISRSLIAAKARYQAVEAKTGVPWVAIAVIHERESSQDWYGSLAQGDRWDRVSVHVPAGRGPFNSWEEAAIDALMACPPYLARKKNWSTPGDFLTNLELYNGIGYASRGVPSPYVWAGTDQYQGGKFVADGVYSPTKVDPQPGCAALIKTMMSLDPSIKFDAPKVSTTTPKVDPPPSISNPSKGSIGAFIASIFAAIFRRK